MNKELYVSSTPHETKVALMEDDQLAEVFFERENEYTLAGSIYKGRVTRVLPGMQSAFVDIGLERDAFLYVSDFLELTGDDDEDEEFGEIPAPRGAIECRKATVAGTAGRPKRRPAMRRLLTDEDDADLEPMLRAKKAGHRRRPGRTGGLAMSKRKTVLAAGEDAVAVVVDVAGRGP